MKRTLMITLAAAFILTTLSAVGQASILPGIGMARRNNATIAKHYVEVEDGVWMAVKGRRERRQVRYARLSEAWSLDQQKVAAQYGWPAYRLREEASGQLTETWSYPDKDVEFVFQVPSGTLIDQKLR